MSDQLFPLILEPHKEDLGFAVYEGEFEALIGFEKRKKLKAVVCPLGESDAI
jgi:hypothetical protein